MSRSGSVAASGGRQMAVIARAGVAGALLKATGMRLAWICVLLAGCSLYLEDHHKKHPPPPPDAIYIPDEGLLTCPYSAPEPTIPCYTPGQVCAYIDAEYDCTCRCGASGYWSCAPEVIGAHCPTLPPPDAGPLYPDAAPYPDGAP